jgi:hypothetical protein
MLQDYSPSGLVALSHVHCDRVPDTDLAFALTPKSAGSRAFFKAQVRTLPSP